MFLTTPCSTWPSLRLAISSERASARLSSSTARRDTTMLPRERSIFRIWNGCGVPINGPTSRTGRMSTWLPGGGELLERHAALGFEPDIDDRDVVFYGDHHAVDDGALDIAGAAERFVEQGGEI